jgi:hypothetical protein
LGDGDRFQPDADSDDGFGLYPGPDHGNMWQRWSREKLPQAESSGMPRSFSAGMRWWRCDNVSINVCPFSWPILRRDREHW